jgi:hypothetical protein
MEGVPPMAIDNELSSEIASALLTGKKRTPSELKSLKETVLKVHLTLQKLTAPWRRNRELRSLPETPTRRISNSDQ